MEGADLLEALGSNLDMASFLAGESTPVFVGSALTNFGVRHLLDAVVDLVPAPRPRISVDGPARDLEAPFSAFVFKVQANMDPSHRDRIAFARICSGTFERGMDTTCARSGKPVLTKYAATVFGSDRDTVEVAYPGDVVGLVNAAGLQLGDTIFAGPKVRFPGIPRFVPEAFATARPKDTGRFKQFRKGLEQLDEEGVVQVLRDPDFGDQAPVIAAVGPLQFDVFAYRLETEFGAAAELSSAPYEAIRLTDAETATKLREVGGIRILRRGDGELVALFESVYRLRRLEGDRPELTLLPLLATTG
jgi:peptide chain release factor 3